MVKLRKENPSGGAQLVGYAGGCFGGGFTGASSRIITLKIRRQRCRTVFIVLCHQLV